MKLAESNLKIAISDARLTDRDVVPRLENIVGLLSAEVHVWEKSHAKQLTTTTT